MALYFGSEFLNSPPPIETTRPFQDGVENYATLTKHRDTYSFIDPWRFCNALTGKIVLITQAHRGVGRSTALAFARAGASVCCVGPTPDSLEPLLREIKQTFNTPTLALTADLLAPGAPAQVVKLVELHRGPVDILINITPASYARSFDTEPDITQDWWPTMESGVRVPVALTHAVLPSMIARGSGIIISTTLIGGVVHIPFMSAQGTAKAALLKFHHHLHLETAKKGILSFAVHPGLIPSHLHDPGISFLERPEHIGQDPEFRQVVADLVREWEWCSAGLASGTFLTLCAEPRARILSGLYVNAERDMEELLTKIEADWGDQVKRERLYHLKVDEY
ncbi:uncharacterized protein L3040_004449 [Drepanopeziza brunnea f. sp. 'multigermtubi']|uniref:Short-chain dehydrogenase/reductase SDR n=1 Tax=Marssonina brunnea f. sp. multigermtubi (strain MB_m1) TaxID=1072389 RepID=K1WJN8_MARBU|nr:short-chain dehydrogenase/reductase SDR [Drepanopeziza brunnea f. sp. 'multigermtubi' MB_m1]EKD17910.1 short-chain dehydrogenase/reductase SDR [Drepanopeziza brunnea f. sp. 'multigermtubi' MB_m1]KAJ5043062.1 hypothetical protein L3040_004449 [Drepanopeziza brunnea f. sp. 'multigermtubi']